MKVIDTPGPGKYGFWCQGSCGDGIICGDLTYKNGYCQDPEAREKMVKKNEAYNHGQMPPRI